MVKFDRRAINTKSFVTRFKKYTFLLSDIIEWDQVVN